MSEDTRAGNVNRGLKQEQPRKAPGKGRANLLYLVIAGLVALTLAVGAVYLWSPSWLSFLGGPQDIVLEQDSKIVFNGLASEMTAGQGNTVVQGVPDESRATVIVRSTRINARPGGTTGGAYVRLKPDVSGGLAGKRIRVTVWARAASERPTSLFGIAYSRAGAGGSGWIALEPTKEIKPYSFAYKVPAAATQNTTGDYIGVWSDISGGNGGLEVRLITVSVLPPPPKPS